MPGYWTRRPRRHEPVASSGATIADGIAIKRPGELTRPLLEELLDGVVTVEEDEIAGAIVLLAERAKLVSEGAGAVALAAVLSERPPPAAASRSRSSPGGTSTAACCRPSCAAARPRRAGACACFTRVADRPGALAELLALVAHAGANLLALEHLREAIPLHVRETGVALTLETRGPEHTRELLEQPTGGRLRGRRAGSAAPAAGPLDSPGAPSGRTGRPTKRPWSGMVRHIARTLEGSGGSASGCAKGWNRVAVGRSAKQRRKGGLRTQ